MRTTRILPQLWPNQRIEDVLSYLGYTIHFVDAELDPRQVRRLVKRVGAYLTDGTVAQDDLEQVFDMASADEAHRRAVRDGLRQLGVQVVVTAGVVADPAQIAIAPAPLHPSGSSLPTYGNAPVESPQHTDEERQLRAAHKLLDDDRWNRSPWKRLLTAEEEVGLARLVRREGHPLHEELPQGFRRSLSDSAVNARAFDALMLHNRGLVWSILRSFIGQGLDIEDLEQSGYRGLRRAVEKFDAAQGVKFSTYATWWIRQAISRAVADEGRLIRLPVYMHERVRSVMAARERLLTERGRARIFDIAAATELRPAQVRECFNLAVGIISLDAPVGDHGDTTLGLLIDGGAFQAEDPLHQLVALAGRQEIHDVVNALSEREASVIRLRFGLDGGEPRTLDAIGREYGVTRERIRQIEKKAMDALQRRLRDRPVGAS